MTSILLPLLALASLGDATQIGLVLFSVTSPKVAKVSKVAIFWCNPVDGFADKLSQKKDSFKL
jgi:hypothetical protein